MSRGSRLLVKGAVVWFVTAIAFYLLFAGGGLSDRENIKLNQIQVIGSHNSYKKPLLPDAKALLSSVDAHRSFMLDYHHAPLSRQLDMGLRHLEIDVLLDPNGKRFLTPFIQTLTSGNVYTPQEVAALSQPGLKVLHVPDMDVASHCLLFEACLSELENWSSRHPEHVPIFVLVNVKESASRYAAKGHTEVLPFKKVDYAVIDREIKAELGNKLITPDLIRSAYPTLNSAIKERGWPSVDSMKGKFIFIFDGNAKQRALYREDNPSLAKRSMFASYAAGEPESAIMIINDPLQAYNDIQTFVKAGYLVRTRADGGNHDGRNKNYQRVQAAFTSGAQIISTDFYSGSPQSQKTGFVVQFDNNLPFFRCNPYLCSMEANLSLMN